MASYQTKLAGNLWLIIGYMLSSPSWYFHLCVEARSTGAPVVTNPDICDTMTPGHQLPAMSDSSPYFITVGSTQYTPGQPLTITVTKATTDTTSTGFRGIFMQMRRTGTDQIVGTWTVSDETNFQTVSCGGTSNNAVTHRNSVPKNFLNTFTWMAPASESSDVNVVATYVDNYSTFWVKEIALAISSTVSDPCNPSPCLNGGTCIQNGNGFICVCAPSYTGTNCQSVNALPCNSNPCVNGGFCMNTNLQSAYSCTCAAGYTGSRCETLLALPCNSNPCTNGGTCIHVNLQSDFFCACPAGYSGTTCQQFLVPPCTSNPCLYGGTCVNTNQQTSFLCTCLMGYSGSRCEQGLPCDFNPCGNGGTCQDVNSQTQFVCSCDTGFSGIMCEIDDPCSPNPCMQQGTCILNGDDFTCNCPPSYVGKTCNTFVSPCNPDPCFNGGTCRDLNLGTEFFCTCPAGYRGITCEEDVPITAQPVVTGSVTTVAAGNQTGRGMKLFYNTFLIFIAIVISVKIM